jgi:hypothetical protein
MGIERAMSTRVMGIVVTGMPRQAVPRRLAPRARWVSIPSILRSRLDHRPRRLALDQAVQVRRRRAHQQPPLAAGEDCGHVRGLDTRGAVADAVDAGVDGDQRTATHALPDLLGAYAAREQLPARHDPV